jgi:hypothetical protein
MLVKFEPLVLRLENRCILRHDRDRRHTSHIYELSTWRSQESVPAGVTPIVTEKMALPSGVLAGVTAVTLMTMVCGRSLTAPPLDEPIMVINSPGTVKLGTFLRLAIMPPRATEKVVRGANYSGTTRGFNLG